jgi:hypothetical protein
LLFDQNIHTQVGTVMTVREWWRKLTPFIQKIKFPWL